MIGLFTIALGLGVFALQAAPGSAPWSLVGGLIVTGIGMGFVSSPLTDIVTRDVESRLLGTASGIFNTSRQLGAVFGSASVGVLLQAQEASVAGEPFRQGFTYAATTLILPIAVPIVGGLVCLLRKPGFLAQNAGRAPEQAPEPAGATQ